MNIDLHEPLTEDELDELESLFQQHVESSVAEYGEDTDPGVCCVSEMDGFLTAIVSAPNTILPSRWLPAMWGEREIVWRDQDEAQYALGLIMRHMNGIAGLLIHDPDIFDPLFIDFEDSDEPFVMAWCAGYVRAMELDDGWETEDDELGEALASILLFGTEFGERLIDEADDESLRNMAMSVPESVRFIHAYWFSRRDASDDLIKTAVRDTPKVGRNQPCPCGSGRKYKHCCLH